MLIKNYIDIYLDLEGWYALGHHDPDQFVKAVAKLAPHADISPQAVRQSWAKFKGNEFEETDASADGAVSITFVENF